MNIYIYILYIYINRTCSLGPIMQAGGMIWVGRAPIRQALGNSMHSRRERSGGVAPEVGLRRWGCGGGAPKLGLSSWGSRREITKGVCIKGYGVIS